jgi:hypothetical protein
VKNLVLVSFYILRGRGPGVYVHCPLIVLISEDTCIYSIRRAASKGYALYAFAFDIYILLRREYTSPSQILSETL